MLRALLVAPCRTASVEQERAFRNVRNGQIQVRREILPDFALHKIPLFKSKR